MSGFDKEALEYLSSKGTIGTTVEIEGYTYVIDCEGRPVAPPRYELPTAANIEETSLSAFVGYLRRNIDKLDRERLQVVVDSPTNVSVRGWLHARNRKRDIFCRAQPILPKLTGVATLDQFASLHDFRLNLLTCFAPTPERNKLLESLRLVKKNTAIENSDDGLNQSLVVKAGVDLVSSVPLPNPVSLAPYRTFLEVQQPVSDFLLRMDGGGEGRVQARLVLVDGGMWDLAARTAVGQDLQALLKAAELDPTMVLW